MSNEQLHDIRERACSTFTGMTLVGTLPPTYAMDRTTHAAETRRDVAAAAADLWRAATLELDARH